ncbi:hypothetical protein GKZ68_20595 (plasmid) [Hymenobacter sp. BRD128]|uniref:hypothetical protein n=1 Tax=Hymenobacter sp. BRD128 TaxID=2675878 RepID=UPI0015675CD1|nr:hypothetical protein [Hymenobacter sp. BRD128]QKG59083.1 hypothetical protein GKZ68_20595 [Hymenobacter sp. BRD128]
MTQTKVKVQVSSDNIQHFARITQQVKEAGMTVSDEIPILGHLRGSVDEDKLWLLQSIPGVASASRIDDEADGSRGDYSIK